MDVLLERPREYFYSESKQTRAKSKTTEELDPEAFEFFKLFLEYKNSFVRPSASGFYRSYNIIENEFLDWPREAYSGTSLRKMALSLIDFRNLPGVDNKDSSTINCPFFMEVMTAFSAAKKPSFDEVSSWLFISGDEKDNSQVLHFIESHEVLNKYGIQHALYEPGKNERLYDAPAARSATKVFLTFLQDKNNSSQVRVSKVFHCPETARYTKPKNYSELEYRIYNSELQMEFYLWVVGIFCHSSQQVFSAFAGGKFTCTAMVSNALMQFSSIQAKLILTTTSMKYRLFDSFHVYRKTSIFLISRFWF